MNRISDYDKFPTISVQTAKNSCWQGWDQILQQIRAQVSLGARRVAIECYPGVFEDEILVAVSEGLGPAQVIHVRDCYKSSREIEALTSRELTDDPVFGRLSKLGIEDFVDPARAASLREQVRRNRDGVSLIVRHGDLADRVGR